MLPVAVELGYFIVPYYIIQWVILCAAHHVVSNKATKEQVTIKYAQIIDMK